MSKEIKDNNTEKSPNSKNNQDYEIDLGQLFSNMGDKIADLIKYIFDTIRYLFLQIVVFTLFIKNNAVKLAIGSIIGLLVIVGYTFSVNPNSNFQTSMTLSPNFGSTFQLYKSIEMFQSMVELEDYEGLSKKMNISIDDAKSLVSFNVAPYMSNSDKVSAYKRFISLADSTTASQFSFDEYFDNASVLVFSYHIVTVTATKQNIFSKLRDPILASIISNDYFADIKETSYNNMIAKMDNLNNSKFKLDTLRNFYQELEILNAQKQATGTNIFMAEQKAESNKELMIFNRYMDINDQILDITKAMTNEKKIVNVVSDFNEIGSKVKVHYYRYGVIGGFGLTLLFLLFVEVNKWMMAYVRDNVKE